MHTNQIKGVKLIMLDRLQRPGIAKPFVLPTKLNYQLRDTKKTTLRFGPAGKTLMGTPQWAIGVVQARPGIAKPVMIAKQADKLASHAVARKLAKVGEHPMGAPGVQISRQIAKKMAADKNLRKAQAKAAEKAAAGFGFWK